MIVRILITLFLVVLCSVLAVSSWNGWVQDQEINNRFVAMFADAQVWLVKNIGEKPSAGIFAFFALLFACHCISFGVFPLGIKNRLKDFSLDGVMIDYF